MNLIRKGPSGAKECIKVLKSNKGNIGMLMDQKMNDGIKANFFGYKVMTASAIARFAIKFKCPIIPAICKRVNGTRFLIKYYPEIKYEKILIEALDIELQNGNIYLWKIISRDKENNISTSVTSNFELAN